MSSPLRIDQILLQPEPQTLTLGAGQRVNENGGSLARRRYQTGSLILRNKRWTARWREDVIGPDGHILRVRRACVIGTLAELPTQKLARRRLELVLARINSPAYRPGRVATLKDFAEKWKTEVLAQRKPSTIMAAQGHLRKHIVPFLGNVRLEDIGVETQQSFVSTLSRKVGRKTLLNVLGTLSSILSTASAWGYTTEVVSRRKLAIPPRRERPRRRFFTIQEIARIVKAAAEPWSTLYLMAALTGTREGELFGLQVGDLDFDRKLIHIRRSVWRGRSVSPKTESSVRTLHIPDVLAARLKTHLANWRPNQAGWLFASRSGTPLNPNHVVTRKLQPLLAELKIERAGLHAFRHSHSSLLIELGAPLTVAQAQLGHSDLTTTMRAYSHVMPTSQRTAVDHLAEVLDASGLTTETTGELIQ